MNDVALAAFGDGPLAEHLTVQPAAAQVRVVQPGPLLVGELEKRRDRLDPGVIDQDVDRAEFLPDSVEHGLDFGPSGDVGLDRHGSAALPADPGRDLFGLGGACRVVDGDVGPLLGEDLGNSPANAPAGPCNERNLSLQLHKRLRSYLLVRAL